MSAEPKKRTTGIITNNGEKIENMMDEEKEYYSLVKRAFDRLAPFYDIVTSPISKERDEVVNFVKAGNGSRILDVGAGTGKQAFAFAEKGHDVIGIDLSESMLKAAKKKNKYENAKFEVADATALPFESDSFDVSCASFVLHDMPLTIREKTVKEMVRVAKPQGVIVIIDYALPENRVRSFFIYHLIKLYEGKYYLEFIKSDLEALLGKSGVEIREELSALLGAGRIIKGIRMDNGA